MFKQIVPYPLLKFFLRHLGCECSPEMYSRRICEADAANGKRKHGPNRPCQETAHVKSIHHMISPFVRSTDDQANTRRATPAYFPILSLGICMFGPLSSCCMAPTFPTGTVTSILPAFSNCSVTGKACPSLSGCLSPMIMICISLGLKMTFPPGDISTLCTSRMRDTPLSSVSL